MSKGKALAAMLAAMEDDSDEDAVKAPPMSLEAAYKLYATKHTFKPGDLVRWKEGMKITLTPAYDENVVIVEVLPEPVYCEKSDGTPYWRQPLDIRYGHFDKSGDFVVFHGESARFEPAE